MWIYMSNTLGLPLSNCGSKSSVESCISTDSNGIRTTNFAWNSYESCKGLDMESVSVNDCESSDHIAQQLVSNIINDAVDYAIINNEGIGNEEFSNFVGDLIFTITNNHFTHEKSVGKKSLSI